MASVVFPSNRVGALSSPSSWKAVSLNADPIGGLTVTWANRSTFAACPSASAENCTGGVDSEIRAPPASTVTGGVNPSSIVSPACGTAETPNVSLVPDVPTVTVNPLTPARLSALLMAS